MAVLCMMPQNLVTGLGTDAGDARCKRQEIDEQRAKKIVLTVID